MAGQMVEFASNGSTAQGYLARAAAGSGPGIVVLQEWWGLVDHIRAVADRLSGEGFTALAPDLYHGDSTTSPDAAGRMMMALDIERAARDVQGAVDYLLGLDCVQGEKVGVVGFCMGGQLALSAACSCPRVGACVDFYGVHPNVALDFSCLEAPVLGLFAENDGFVTPDVARKLQSDLEAAGKKVEFHIYPGVGHAFFNDSRPDAYDATAAKDAWSRLLMHFGEHLRQA